MKLDLNIDFFCIVLFSIVSSFYTSLPTQRRVASPGNTYIFFVFYRTHSLKADSEEELEGWFSALRSKQVRVWD